MLFFFILLPLLFLLLFKYLQIQIKLTSPGWFYLSHIILKWKGLVKFHCHSFYRWSSLINENTHKSRSRIVSFYVLMKTQQHTVAQLLCSFSLSSHLLGQICILSLLYSPTVQHLLGSKGQTPLLWRTFRPPITNMTFGSFSEMGFDNFLLASCTKLMRKSHYIFQSQVSKIHVVYFTALLGFYFHRRRILYKGGGDNVDNSFF